MRCGLILAAAAYGLFAGHAIGTNAFASDLPSPTNPLAVWSTPGDGRLVMIARNSGGFTSPIAARVRVCVTNFTGTNNSINLFIWTTSNTWDTTPSAPLQQNRQLQLGDCVEIDQPAALIVQDATISGIASGYYQLLDNPAPLPSSSALPKSASQNTPIKHSYGIYLKPVLAAQVNIDCAPISNVAPETGPTNDYHSECPLTLNLPIDDTRKGIRICFGNSDVILKDSSGVHAGVYAASLLQMIVAKAFWPPTNMPSSYDYNWNPVTPNGCRDVIGPTSEIKFMIGPNNPPYPLPWDPTTVQRIDAAISGIYWNDNP
jgi:hypothetical protein